MNKYEQAWEVIYTKLSKKFAIEHMGELGIIDELVRRATPMKPYNQSKIDFGNCSHCKSELESGKPFCPNCGQYLDWSEVK